MSENTMNEPAYEVLHSADEATQLFAIFCRSSEDWATLKAREPFLEKFPAAEFSCGVSIHVIVNSTAMLRKFGLPDQDPHGLRSQWDWLRTSEIAAQFPG